LERLKILTAAPSCFSLYLALRALKHDAAIPRVKTNSAIEIYCSLLIVLSNILIIASIVFPYQIKIRQCLLFDLFLMSYIWVRAKPFRNS